jgi:hypothetical protein
MTKDKKINKVLKDDPIPDPVYSQFGELSFGLTVSLDGVDYNFRTNTQGYLELNNLVPLMLL